MNGEDRDRLYFQTSTSSQRFTFTVIELVVIIVAITALFGLLLTGLPRAKQKARSQQCVNNLKQVGLAFRQFGTSQYDCYVMNIPTSQGGSRESITNGEVFRTFEVMSNELNTPKILICPADTRTPATNFGPSFANSNISYFVGIADDETQPQMLLSGDRNLTNGPLPPNRLLVFTTNSAPGWNHELHRFRGTVALADGSVQSPDLRRLHVAVTNASEATVLAIP